MNNKNIHDYLDGGLDAGAERDLFAAMGESDELRQEFADQQKLHGIIKKDMAVAVTPPELTNAVFAQLGFTPPGVVSPVTPPAPSFAGKMLAWLGGTTGYVLTGIGAAIITVWLLVPKSEKTAQHTTEIVATETLPTQAENSAEVLDKPQIVKSSESDAADANTQPPPTESSLVNYDRQNVHVNNRTEKMHVNTLDVSPESNGKREKIANYGAQLTNKESQRIPAENSEVLRAEQKKPATEETLQNPEESITQPFEENAIITTAAPMPYPMRTISKDSAGLLTVQQSHSAVQSSNSNWSLHVRTVQHLSSNLNDIIFIFKPYFSVGALYSINPYHAIGGEGGYESFRTPKEVTDNTTSQWQDVWWGGFSYKASFPQLSPTEYIVPDIRLSIGMTTTGGTPTPGVIFRATGGLTVAPGNGINYTAGVESAWLFLPGDKQFTSAQRFGFVLGVGIEL